MKVYTTDTINGLKVIKNFGLVKGNTVRARHVGHDIMASIRNLVGGEIIDYTKMIAESREQALDRMRDSAESLGANAVIGVRFATSSVMANASEILAYGTAVILAEDQV